MEERPTLNGTKRAKEGSENPRAATRVLSHAGVGGRVLWDNRQRERLARQPSQSMQNRKAMGAKNDVKGLKPDVKGCARPFVFSRGKMPDSPEFKNSVCHSHNVAFTDNHINECIGRDACFDPLSGTLMPMATQDHVSGESVTGLKVTE